MITFDPDSLTSRSAELEQEMSAPGSGTTRRARDRIWTEHARVTKRLERYERLQRRVRGRRRAARARPDSGRRDRDASSQPLRRELERLQEAALFNGEYDTGDAVVTIQSGTGGTDAQDWTEMLLRMYLRWATDRGFQAELLEASPGEEAGLKTATLTVKGENAYGILKAERGKHRLVRLSRSTAPIAARPRSRR